MNTLYRFGNRVLSLLVVLMLLLSMMPAGVMAVEESPNEIPSAFTITVRNNDDDLLNDIIVSYRIFVGGEEYTKNTVKTSEGIAVIQEISDIRSSQTADDGTEIKLSASFSGKGYDDYELKDELIEENSNIQVVMNEKEMVSVTLNIVNSSKQNVEKAKISVDGYSSLTGQSVNGEYVCSLYKDENYRITVSKSGYHTYTEDKVFSTDETLKIVLKSKTKDKEFKFEKSEQQTIVYGENSFVNIASTTAQRPGKITYKVTSGDSVAVDSSTGAVTTLKVGTSEISATIPEDDVYAKSSAKYSIEVKAAEQSGFAFEIPEPANIKFESGLEFKNTAFGGDGTGTITYSVEGDSATINSKTGVLTIRKAGTVTVTANKEADDRYSATSASYTLTIDKAEQNNFKFETVSPSNVLITAKSFTNNVVGGNGKGKITYQIIQGNEFASIKDPSSSTVTLLKVGGPIVVQASKEGDDSFNSVTAQYRFSIIKSDQDQMMFEKSNPVEIYSPGKTFANKLIGGSGKGKVTYSVISGDAAVIDEQTGVLSILKASDEKGVVVRAVKAADDEYKEQWAEYTIIINKADQTGFEFADGKDVVKTWSPDNNKYANIAVGGQSSGKVSYSIVGTIPEMPYGGYCISFDSQNASVVMKGKGAVRIKAVKAADDCYNAAETEYKLTINRAEQDKLVFDTIVPESIKYNENGNVISLSVIGGSGDGKVTYSLESGDAVSVKGDKAYIIHSGIVKIKAVKADTNCYEAVSAVTEIKIEKADQYIEFDDKTTSSVTYGQEFANAAHEIVNDSVPDKKGHSDSVIKYEITEGKNIASVDENGKLIFQNNAVGKVTVKAFKSGDDCYNDTETYYSINVCFADVPDNPYSLVGEKLNEKGWFAGDVTIKPAEDYLISESNSLLENDWLETLVIDTEGPHPITIYLKKDNEITAPIEIDGEIIRIDKTTPINLSVSYSESVMNSIFEMVSFGFYHSPVTVTIEATDVISHIDSFVYKVGDEEKNVERSEISYSKDSKKAWTQFTIEPQYRGSISFTAYDTAGNKAVFHDKNVIIVDDVAPGVTVSFDNNNAENVFYYSNERTATITVDESNFFYEFLGTEEIEQHLKIVVSKITDDGTQTIKVYKNDDFDIPFEETEPGSGIWTCKIYFKENADYTLTIECADFSGNNAEPYSTSFTIDNIKPQISITYDSKLQETGYAKEKCTATVTVVEHNFKASDVNLTYMDCVDVQGNNVDILKDYENLLKSNSNWIHNGDIHKINILFDTDANYKFGITYTDLAGNESEEPVDSGLIVDKTAPVGLSVTYSTSVINTILKSLTFGFYDAPVTVNISADDITSGIEYFTCAYEVQVGASLNNTGHEDFVVSDDDIIYTEDGRKAEASFEIPCQFRGSVSFTATDRAGNVSDVFKDNKVIVVDDIAPGVAVSYQPSNNISEYENYFNENRTASISISESNFFEESFEKITDIDKNELIDEHLIINVIKTSDDGVSEEYRIKSADMTTAFIETGEDVWTATILFDDDADYTWEIIYKDFSGNEAGKFIDSFTIDKIKPEISIVYDNNDVKNIDHYSSDRKAIVKVKEHNFEPKDIVFKYTAKDIQGNTVADVKDYQDILRSAVWTQNGNEYTTQINFEIDARYNFEMSYTDMAGNVEVRTLTDEFCIDKLSPALSNLKISYSNSVADIILQTITFGFYKSPVTVTISGDDITSGIDFFTYSYTVSSGESRTNKGKNNVVIPTSDIKYADKGKNASASFTIPAQFRGNVSFTATDRSGNQSQLFTDKKCIVVDNVIPNVTVKYDNYSSVNTTYYKSSRTATITINEANFFTGAFDKNKDLNVNSYLDEHLIIKVTSVSNEEVSKTVVLKNSDLTEPFKKVSEDAWSAKLLFANDADYTWSIEYKDFSGNDAGKFTDSFTIDNTDPEIEVKHYNNDVRNGQYFNANREADIIITEHNFRAQDVVVTVKTTQATGAVNDYQKQLSDPSNWKTSGNVHTARVRFSTEANYSFDIVYTDMSGRNNKSINYGVSASPKKFTIDKTAPTNADIKINGVSVLARNGVSFERFYQEAVDVRYSVNCDISGLNNIKYQKVPAVASYSERGVWNVFNNKVTIIPDEKFVIYFRAEDNAGNYSIVNSIGIVVDKNAPVGEKFSPEIDIIAPKPNKNNLYNSDVTVDVVVVEPGYKGTVNDRNGYYSGLNHISYKIYTKDTSESESGILFDLSSGKIGGAVKDSDNLMKRWTGSIKIDSVKFNSNNVVVEITAEDNAGNQRVTTNDMLNVPISIDVTEPKISVSYDNNDGDRTFANASTDAYFKADRIARIVITERNFDPNHVNIIINHQDKVNISGWSENKSFGNGDNNTHTATITYFADDDYTFDINCTDQADNKNTQVDYNNSLAPEKFTVDKSAPRFSISYDNNNKRNNNYYNAKRTAILKIEEHNFETSRINVILSASDNGSKSSAPKVEGWTSNGDVHTTVINFENDSYYSLNFEYADKAGNKIANFSSENFYIDKTSPFVSISKIVDEHAYNDSGKIGYAITATDTNFDVFEPSLTAVVKKDENFEIKKLDEGTMKPTENGLIYEVDNLESDGIYRITCSVIDKAGNEYSEVTLSHSDGTNYVEKRHGDDTLLSFSVNRNGSTYELDENTLQLLDRYYVKYVTDDIFITEINADPIEEYNITVNGEVLSTDDCSVQEFKEDEKWYRYVYKINKAVFENEGEYIVVAASKDKAANHAFSDIKGKGIKFVVDRTAPVVTVTGLSSNGRYQTDVQRVTISPTDNGGALKSIIVLLVDDDGKEITQLLNLSDDAFAKALEDGNGELSFDVPNGLYQNVRIVCDDMSYNDDGQSILFDTTITNVSITSSAFLIFWANRPLRWGVIIGIVFVISILVFVIIKASKRKK